MDGNDLERNGTKMIFVESEPSETERFKAIRNETEHSPYVISPYVIETE